MIDLVTSEALKLVPEAQKNNFLADVKKSLSKKITTLLQEDAD